MISEKTVELNVTAELLAWLRYATGITHTAIGPSPQQEAVWGYDVSFHGGSTAAALIQYKRAHVTGTVWTWKLNRTVRRDQHARLQFLESRGYPVFYAFPHFAMPIQLVALRRRLLVATSWFPPSYIQPPGGPTGRHEVTFDVNKRPPLTIDDVIQAMEGSEVRHMSVEEFAATLNRVMLAADLQFSKAGDERDAESDFSGQSLLLRHRQ